MAEFPGMMVPVGADDAALRRVLAQAETRVDQFAGRVDGSLRRTAGAFDGLGAAAGRLTGVLAGIGIANTAGEAIKAADAWNLATSKIALFAGAGDKAVAVQEQLFAVAQRSRSALEPTVGLYTSLADSMLTMGKGQAEVIRLTETIGKTFKISGTEAGAAAGALTQLSQAMGSGVLRGDEFNSVMEASPRLAKALAEGLGVPRAALKALAEQGALSAEKVVNALLKQSTVIDSEFGRLAVTVGDSMTVLGNAVQREMGRLDKTSGLTAGLSSGILSVAGNFDTLAQGAIAAGAALGTVYAARGLAPAIAGSVQFVASQAALRGELKANTGHLLQKEAALRAGAAATVESAAADLAAAQAAQTKARADLAARAAQMENAVALDGAIGRTARLIQAEQALTAARTARAAADARAAETTVALTVAQDAQASVIARTGLAATVASRGMALLSGAMTLVGGPVGVALLAGAGAVALFATRTTEAEAAATAFTAAQQAARDVVQGAALEVEALATQYAGLSDSMKAVTRLKLEEALAKQTEAIAAQRRAAAAEVYQPSTSPFRIVEGNHGSDTLAEVHGYERLGLAAAEVDKLRAAFDAFRDAAADDPEAIASLAQTLESVGRSAGDAGKPLMELARKLADPATMAENAARTAKELSARLALIANPADDAAKAVLAAGQTAEASASRFDKLGTSLGGVAGKLTELAGKRFVLSLPEGLERRVGEMVGPPPDAKTPIVSGLQDRSRTADDSAYQTWQATGDVVRGRLRTSIVPAESAEAVRLLKLEADATERLSKARASGSPAAVKEAEVEVELAKRRREGLDPAQEGATRTELLRKARAELSGEVGAQVTQLTLDVAAQQRLTAAAGKGEAAQRGAAAANRVAAASLKGYGDAAQAAETRIEALTVEQLRKDADQPVLARIANQKALVAAYAVGPKAVQAAEIAETAHTLALKEGAEGTARYAEAKAHYIGLLEEQAHGEAAVAAGPMLQQQRDQLALGQQQLALIGASAEQRAVELARTQALIDLRGKNIDAASKEGRTYLANAEALAKQSLELERANAAYDELAKFGERGMDAVLTKLVAAGKSTMSWADAVGAVGIEFQQLALKMALINPVKNWALGTNLPTLFDLGGGAQTGQSGGLSGSLTNTALSKGAAWGMDTLFPGGLSASLDKVGYSALGIGTMAGTQGTMMTTAAGGLAQSAGVMPTLGGVSNAAAAGGTTVGGITGGLSGYLGAAGAGALGGTLGGMLGTATNSKAVGGISGAALGAGAGYLSSLLGLGAMGGPVGLAIAAVVGGIMGMLGTTKTSVGPNAAGNIFLDRNGAKSGPSAGDNGMDGDGMRRIGDAASQSINAIVRGIGAQWKVAGESAFAHFQMFQEGDKWSFSDEDGNNKQEFTNQEAFLNALIKTSIQRLDREGKVTGVNADVRTALTNSTATKAEDLAADLGFAAGFRPQFDAMRSSLDPTNNQLRVFTETAKTLGERIKTNITDWRAKASELGLATETELTEAARKGIAAMMGLGPAVQPLVGMTAVTEQARIEFEAFRPALVGLGHSAAEVADLATRYTAKARDAYDESAALLQRQGAVAVAALTNGNARLSTADQFRAAGATRETVTAPAFASLTGTLDAMAATAQRGALTVADVNWQMGALNKALYDGVLTVEQYGGAVSMVTGAFQASQQVLSTLRQGWDQIAAITEPHRRRTATDVLDGAMVNGGAEGVAAFRTQLDALFGSIRAGSASFGDLDYTYRQLVPLLQSGVLTGDQFNSVVGAMTTAWNDAATTAAATAAYQGDINARMHTAVGNLRAAGLIQLDVQQASDLVAARANGQDTSRLLIVQAAERALQAFTLAQQDVTAWYDRQIAAQQDIVTALQDGAVKVAQIARQFADARGSLREGEESPLAPGVRMAEAEERFRAAHATATSTTATETETDAARQLLLQLGPQLVAMEKAASGNTASALFNLVDGVFQELGDTTALGVDSADRQLQTARNTLKELQRARTDAANLGQRQLGGLTDLTSIMTQSYAVWQAALVPLQGLTGTRGGATVEQMTAGLTAGSLPSVMTWARAQGASTVQQVLQAADAQLGWASNPYRYQSPAALAGIGNFMTSDDFLGVMRSIGFSGDVGAANSWIAAYGKAGDYENAVRAWAHDHGVPGFQTGGVIGNGAYGRDSVLARFAGGGTVMLAGGEGVLTAGATASIGPGAVDFINRHHRLPVNDLAPLSPTIAFRRPDLGNGGGAGVAELLAAVEGLRAEVRAIGADDRTQRARIGADAAALLARIEGATSDLPRKLANTRRAA